ncbi:MAG: hypothetical protein V3S44_00630 [Alphaproteobacteria bacterium]
MPALAAALLLALAGCAEDRADMAPCPQAKVLEDPAQLIRYRQGPGRDLTDVVFEASFARIAGECSYDEEGGEIVVELTVLVDVLRGPANGDGKAVFSYFVALSEYATDGRPAPDVISREAFTIDVEFTSVHRSLRYTDVLDVTVPRPDNRDARNYVFYFGFEMTPEELANNRRSRAR